MNHRIEKIWQMGKLIKSIRSHATGDGDGKTLCAEFHISVYEAGDYDKVTVQVEASNDAITLDQVCACAYFLWLTAQNCAEADANMDTDKAMLWLCDEAKKYEDKIISMPRRE